jgi:hypothetical protein
MVVFLLYAINIEDFALLIKTLNFCFTFYSTVDTCLSLLNACLACQDAGKHYVASWTHRYYMREGSIFANRPNC